MLGKEKEIENIEKNQSSPINLFKKINKEFFEFNPEKEFEKAISYKILNTFHYKDNIQNSSSLKKFKNKEYINPNKEKQFQIFKIEENINNKKHESILKANFNPKRSLSFSKNEMLLKKNNIFLEKYTKTKSEIKSGIKSKIDIDKTIANNSNLDNINNNLKLNNDKNKKMSNSLIFSFNDEKEEKNIKILNQIEQFNNLKGKKYKNNNLSEEYLNKEHNI